MANEQIHQHFEQFIKENPDSQVFEAWVAKIHPENAEEDLLGFGDAIIDAKFYDSDNEYLKYWNNHLDNKRSPVKVSSSGKSNKNDGNESDDSSPAYRQMDLLSGDGDEDSQASPTSVPRRTVEISPGEDLMKFD